jgi:hypothetical protein
MYLWCLYKCNAKKIVALKTAKVLKENLNSFFV